MIKIKGILTDPFGNPLPNVTVRFTATTNGSDVIAFLTGSISTGSNGSYDFNLKMGKYLVEFNQTTKEYSDSAVINLTVDTGEVTLENLIAIYKVCESDEPVCPKP